MAAQIFAYECCNSELDLALHGSGNIYLSYVGFDDASSTCDKQWMYVEQLRLLRICFQEGTQYFTEYMTLAYSGFSEFSSVKSSLTFRNIDIVQ